MTSPQGMVFVLVPHAETDQDDAEDPSLSRTGHARARALNDQLGGAPLAAIFADEFRRTGQTAMPAQAVRGGMALSHYFSRGPLAETARQWRGQFSHGNVLVIGEPESIAPLANALCDCTVTPLHADQSDRLIRITRIADQPVRVDDHRYGASTP